MKQYTKYAVWLMPLVLLGCFFGKVPMNKYYLLDYIPTPEVRRQTTYNLRVKELRISEAYRRPEIIYRQSPHELLFYNYHQWAVKPEHLVASMVLKHVRASKLFKSVSESLVDFRPDYTLTGNILAIEEYDNEEKWYAHLAVSFQLESERTHKIVWQKTYDLRKVVAQQEPVYVVRELSFLLETILDQMIKELSNTLPAAGTSPAVGAAPAPGATSAEEPDPESSEEDVEEPDVNGGDGVEEDDSNQ